MLDRLPVSISTIVLMAGLGSTVWGFIEYNDPILNLIGIFTGIPLLLGGLVMRVVELKPVPNLTVATQAVIAAREAQATEIQKQIFADITKYTYGASVHMEDALEFLKLKVATDADLPRLVGYAEELVDDRYLLRLRFDSPKVPYSQWQQAYDEKMGTFFGRDVQVTLAQLPKDQVELGLIAGENPVAVAPQASSEEATEASA